MKILVVQETSWIKRGPHQQHHLFERLISRGHDVLVLDYDFTWKNKHGFGMQKKLVRKVKGKVMKHIKVKVITPNMIKLPILNRLSIIYYHTTELIKVFKQFKPDILFVFGILNSNIALSLSRLYGVKSYFYVIDHLHALLEGKIEKNIAKVFEISNAKKCYKILVINDGLGDYLKSISKIPKEKIQKIAGGVDIESYKIQDLERMKIREYYSIAKNQRVLFFMGYLYEFTRLDLISKKILSENMKNYTIFIVGDGPLFRKLRTIKEKFDKNNQLILTGWIGFEEIPLHLSAADICILPSINNEVMSNIVPIKYYEYLAAKKTVVSTNFNGVIREFGYDSGVRYFKNLDEFYELIAVDESILKKTASNGYSKIIKSDWNNLVDIFEGYITK